MDWSGILALARVPAQLPVTNNQISPAGDANVQIDTSSQGVVVAAPEWQFDPSNIEFLKLLVCQPIRIEALYAPDPGLSLYEYIMTRHPLAWSEFFLGAQVEVAHACQMISREITTNGKSIFPFTSFTLRAFYLTPVFAMKAVIIGQDPYPGFTKSGMPKAIGACFASDRLAGEIPDSLQTIYHELAATVEDWKHPGHPDITSWGMQGVLLLNTALTVEAGKAGAHVGYWKPFTEKLMEYINEKCKDVVFLLWGKIAQKAADTIYSSKHLKLTSYHPSPMNNGKEGYSFRGCNHFNLANIHLASKGIRPIDWRIK